MFTHTKKQGFTLIELMVVVSIISILTTASLGLYLDSWKQARDAVRLQDMRSINQALVAFYIDNRRFPDEANDGVIESGQLIGVGNEIDDALRPYLPEVPQDPAHDAGTGVGPSSGSNFFYSYNPIHLVYNDCSITELDARTRPEAYSAPVFGFNRFEVALIRDTSLVDEGRDIDTCHGNNMRQNDADYNRVPQ
jgi:prepilin-type N-terminal cleavage/methylation domain-containing protein